MPHCLAKINRVAYGLLGDSDRQAASAPESRRLMAVPFLAKVEAGKCSWISTKE